METKDEILRRNNYIDEDGFIDIIAIHKSMDEFSNQQIKNHMKNKIKMKMKMKILSEYKYKYSYSSPFGESWCVYRLLFYFIPIKYYDFEYEGYNTKTLIENEINKLNKKNKNENTKNTTRSI